MQKACRLRAVRPLCGWCCEGTASPYLVDCALHLDQLDQVDVNALQVLVAAVALQDDCGGFA